MHIHVAPRSLQPYVSRLHPDVSRLQPYVLTIAHSNSSKEYLSAGNLAALGARVLSVRLAYSART